MQQAVSSELKPLKAMILGPPASGKTTLSKKVCRRYGAHYVNVKTMIEETLESLKAIIEKEKEENDEIQTRFRDADEEMEGEGGIHAVSNEYLLDCRQQIFNITDAMEKSENNRLPDDMVARLMKKFLVSDVCQKRGFVLDGFPKTVEQISFLFGDNKASKTAVGGEDYPKPEGRSDDAIVQIKATTDYTHLITPDFIVSLEATDDFLCKRVMKLPQKLVHGTHFDEVGMIRRLAEYHANNDMYNSVLKYFDNMDINPILIKIVDEETSEELSPDDLFNFVCEIFGEPVPGFGLSLEEEEAIKKLEMEEIRLLLEQERAEKLLMEKEAKKEYEEKMEKWNETLEKLQLEEEKVLAAETEPLRFYLMKYIFPTLSKGLIEVAKVKPEDPVDFLAEYLFRENPEGKMFDPSYTREGEKVLLQYEEEVKPITDIKRQLE